MNFSLTYSACVQKLNEIVECKLAWNKILGECYNSLLLCKKNDENTVEVVVVCKIDSLERVF